MKKRTIYILLFMLLFAAVALSGCSTAKTLPEDLGLPEAGKLQTVLDSMSKAVLDKDQDKYLQAFSEDCPQKQEETADFKNMTTVLAISKYSQTITKAKRIYDGIVCTVQIYSELQLDGKRSVQTDSKEVYFILEKGAWKIADNDYYPLMDPPVVAGSDSVLYDTAVKMSDDRSYKLLTDKTHLQTYGDIILVGTPYDNASILDLEQRGLTRIKVTEDYPGNDDGIVQVLSNVDNYRYVIIIQGSSDSAAQNAVEFMDKYFSQNPFINTGVYFIRNNRLEEANELELTTLTTLDPEKTDARLKEVQQCIEANISMLRDELQSSQEQLSDTEKSVSNPYRDDYYTAFMGSDRPSDTGGGSGRSVIPADFTDKRLCTWAFELPAGSNPGTIYSYAGFLKTKLADISQPTAVENGLFSQNDTRKKTAAELYSRTDSDWKIAGDQYSVASLSTAMLRLLGFTQDEAFSCLLNDSTINFLNIGDGYAAVAKNGTMTVSRRVNANELKRLENDSVYVDFAASSSNVEAAKISGYLTSINNVFRLKKGLNRSKANSITLNTTEQLKNDFVLYNVQDILGMLKDIMTLEEDPCIYPALNDSKAGLRSVMGDLLSVKDTQYLMNFASLHPGSSHDYALYAAGFLNVEYPNAYAQGAAKSPLVQKTARSIQQSSDTEEGRLQKLLELLDGITNDSVVDDTAIVDDSVVDDTAIVDGQADRFLYPDTCLTGKTGSPSDKALLLYGLYRNLQPDNENVYVAIGRESAYLAYKADDSWKFIDCKDNMLKSFVTDDLWLCFNESRACNEDLEIGDKPEFAR